MNHYANFTRDERQAEIMTFFAALSEEGQRMVSGLCVAMLDADQGALSTEDAASFQALRANTDAAGSFSAEALDAIENWLTEHGYLDTLDEHIARCLKR
jgi:hypothetical protein